MGILRCCVGLFCLSTELSAQIYLLTIPLRADRYSYSEKYHYPVTIDSTYSIRIGKAEPAGIVLAKKLPFSYGVSSIFRRAPAGKIPVKIYHKSNNYRGTIADWDGYIHYVDEDHLEQSSVLLNINDISEEIDPTLLPNYPPYNPAKAGLRLAIGRGNISKAKELIDQYSLEIDPDMAQALLSKAVTYCYPSASANRLTGARFLIENGARMDTRNDRRQTLLHVAAENNCQGALPMLLGAGSDPNSQDNEGETPLATAVRRGYTRLARDLISVTDVNIADSNGRIPLHRALDRFLRLDHPHCRTVQSEVYGGKEICAQEELVLALVEAGSNINAPWRGMRTPFMNVVKKGDNEMLEFFLEAGANVNERQGFSKETPLHAAAKEGLNDKVTILLEHGADPTIKLSFFGGRKTAAQVAEENGHIAVVQTIARFSSDNQQKEGIDARDSRGRTALHRAVRQSNLEEVASLLERGANPNVPNHGGQYPLTISAHKGKTKIVKVLLDGGANPNIHDHRGRHPLTMAAHKGRTKVVKVLLEGGVDPNIPDYRGRYPLTMAAHKGKTEVVKILLSGGADPDLSDSSGRNALHMAGDYNRADMIPFLFEGGANPNALRSRLREETPLMISIRRGNTEAALAFINGGADPNFSDSSGRNALHVASHYNRTDMIPFLLEGGANPNALRSGPEEETPLMISVRRGNTEAALALVPHMDIKTVDPFFLLEVVKNGLTPLLKPLIRMGLDPDRARATGRTALHAAARRGDEEAVRILLGAGVSRDPKGGLHQKTPLFLAAGEGHAEVVRLLVANGADPTIRHRGWMGRRGHLPAEEARKNGHTDIAEMLESLGEGREMID